MTTKTEKAIAERERQTRALQKPVKAPKPPKAPKASPPDPLHP